MKLDNLTPEQKKEWQALVEENRLLKEKLSQNNPDAPALLARPDFIREVARMAAYDERYGSASTILSLSFEGLEPLLQTQGPAYHAVIQAVADTLVRHVRSCDIVGRTGIDNFGVLLTHCSTGAAETKAENLITKIRNRLDPLLESKAAVTLRYAVAPLELKK
jgi:GGDEF domain-containing protein